MSALIVLFSLQISFAQVPKRDSIKLPADSLKPYINDSTQLKPRRITISILAPFYLDSLFTGSRYRYNQSIPKFALSALEFYNGVEIAADWLDIEGIPVDIQVIDSRKHNSFVTALASPEFGASQMIIAVLQNPNELRSAAQMAMSRNIPLVSATYPNDANVTNSPNLLIMNSTLRTHCGSIYRFVQREHSLDNIVLLTRKSSAGDFVKNFLMDAHKNTPALPLDWKELVMDDDDDPSLLIPMLDSTRTNTIIVSSLNEMFAQKLVKKLSSISKSYTCNVVGMPTWDGYKLEGSEYKGVNIYYSTPFADETGNHEMYKALLKQYKIRANSNPSDMAIRGFEATYRFAKTLSKHPQVMQFLTSVNQDDFKVFNSYHFLPVVNESGDIQYLENSHVYMVNKLDGVKKSVR